MRVGLIGSGYVAGYFGRVFERRGVEVRGLGRVESVEWLRERVAGLDFVVNAAGFAGKPNVDACERERWRCLQGNAVLPGIVREACEGAGVPWGHVSSGCVYSGGVFSEGDRPNFTFREERHSFYSGTKALGEEVLEGAERCYVWRLRIPFSGEWDLRNYLAKVLTYERLLDARNSLSQIEEFAEGCWGLVVRGAPFGTYNVVNPGSVTTREVAEILRKRGLKEKFDFFESEEAFLKTVKAPRSNCVLRTEKMEGAGIRLTEVHEAVDRAAADLKR